MPTIDNEMPRGYEGPESIAIHETADGDRIIRFAAATEFGQEIIECLNEYGCYSAYMSENGCIALIIEGGDDPILTTIKA